MGFLLDTNILSDMMRHPRGLVARKASQIGEPNLCTSIIVVAEVRFGAIRRGSSRLIPQLEAVLAGLEVLAFESPAEVVYGELRARLERAGTPIGANDMLIAAQTIALNHVLVTDNEREFSRIPELTVENWLR